MAKLLSSSPHIAIHLWCPSQLGLCFCRVAQKLLHLVMFLSLSGKTYDRYLNTYHYLYLSVLNNIKFQFFSQTKLSSPLLGGRI